MTHGATPIKFCKPQDHKWKATFWKGRIVQMCVNCPTYRDKRAEQENKARGK